MKNFSFCLFFFLLTAVSCEITAYTPYNTHIAFGDSPDNSPAMSVTFTVKTPPSDVYISYSELNSNHTFISRNFYTSIYYKSTHYHFSLTNLTMDTVYTYICVSHMGNDTYTDGPYSFSTKTTTRTARFALFGDMGITHSDATVENLKTHMDSYDFVIHVGDFAYADDRLFARQYENVWDTFHERIKPIAAQRPYMTTPGNHEASCHNFGRYLCNHGFRNFSAYLNRFNMPYQSSHSPSPMFYSFNYANIHFISLSTETDYPHSPEGPGTFWNCGPFGDQLSWLENDLEQANSRRDEYPWIIVYGHRPLYTSSKDKFPWKNQKQYLRDAVEKLFYTYDVDVYMCGHVHFYERLYPIGEDGAVFYDYKTHNGIVHLITGNAGNIEGYQRIRKKDIIDASAFRDDDSFGFGVFQVVNDLQLNWTFFGEQGDVLDSVEIFKKNKTLQVH